MRPNDRPNRQVVLPPIPNTPKRQAKEPNDDHSINLVKKRSNSKKENIPRNIPSLKKLQELPSRGALPDPEKKKLILSRIRLDDGLHPATEQVRCSSIQKNVSAGPGEIEKRMEGRYQKLKSLKRQRFNRDIFEEKAINEQELQEIRPQDTLKAFTFMGDQKQRQHYQQYDLISDIVGHTHAFREIMHTRANKIRIILDWWLAVGGKNSTHELQHTDLCSAADAIKAILTVNKFKDKLDGQNSLVIIDRCIELLNNKHLTYVKQGLKCTIQLINVLKSKLEPEILKTILNKLTDSLERLKKLQQSNPQVTVAMMQMQKLAKELSSKIDC